MLTARIVSFKRLQCSYNDGMSYVDERPRVGISRCLLGDEVRYDGGHKRDTLLLATLGSLVEWIPVCPEVESGMSTPREPIHLVAAADGVRAGAARVRLLGVESRADWTETMTTFATSRVRALVDQHLDGYVLKADSPSCGLERVGVHRRDGVDAIGQGLFAEALTTAFPDLPIAEERSLSDRAVRDTFIERIREHQRRRLARRQA
jgi:uncharacterized protein YbbK (DUF523 family)